jgi:hypothetical protein
MNTTQSMTGSADEPNESVAASWLPESIDADGFVTDPSVDSEYLTRGTTQRRFRPALAAALLALGLSAGLAGSAWAHQATSSPVASSLASAPSSSGPASVLPANLAGGDDDAEDGPTLPATGSSVGLTTGAATGGSAAANTTG